MTASLAPRRASSTRSAIKAMLSTPSGTWGPRRLAAPETEGVCMNSETRELPPIRPLFIVEHEPSLGDLPRHDYGGGQHAIQAAAWLGTLNHWKRKERRNERSHQLRELTL
jgi:hypothetical protein